CRPGGTVDRSAAIRLVPAILNPLGHIARHVKKSKTVGPKRSRGQRLSRRSAAAILTICVAVSGGAAPPKLRARSCARSGFPLGLAGPSISLLGLLREPGHKSLGIVPADIQDRTTATAPTVVVRPVLASSRSDAKVPFVKGDFPTSDRKRIGDHDSMLGLLIY